MPGVAPVSPTPPVVVDLPRSDRVRKASDVLRLVVALVLAVPGVLLAVLGSEAMAGAQGDVLQAFGRLPPAVRSAAIGIAQLLALAAPVVLAVVLVAQRRFRLLAMVVVAAAAATLLAVALGHTVIADAQPGVWERIVEQESWVTGRAFPTSAYLAGAASAVTVLGAWIGRRWRDALWLGLGVAAVTRIVSGADLPLDLVVALCLGVAMGSIVLLVAGAPDRAPPGTAVAAALGDLGFPVARLEEQPAPSGPSRHYRAQLHGREPLLVKVHDADDRDRDLLYRLWNVVRLRTPVEEQLVTTVREQAEREAFLALWLRDSGAPVPRPVAVGPVLGSAMLVARQLAVGDPLPDMASDATTDATLDAVWGIVAQLRAARVAHRSLDTDSFVVDDTGSPWLVRVAGAELGAPRELLDLDVAHLLVALASHLGVDRSVASCRRVLGDDAVRDGLPYVQVLALPLPLRLRLRGHEDVVSGVRAAIVTATGAEPAELARLQRVRPATLLVIAGALLALLVLLPQLTSLEQAGRALGDADYVWLVPAVLAIPLLYVGATVGLLGALGRRMSFGPTYLAQLAAAFLNRMTPNGVGGLGLNLRFLQKAGFETTTAGAAMALNSLAGGLANVVLLGVFVTWAGQSDEPVFELPDRAVVLAVFAVVLAVVGTLTLVPAARRMIGVKVGGLARRTAAELHQVAADPIRLAMLLVGSLAAPLSQILVLSLVLQAFGGGVALAALGAVYIGGHAVGSAAPTPGGLGGVEAALIAGLSGIGVEAGVATSAVLVYRLVTYWLVIPCGWLALRHLRSRQEV
jgi:uncharacterized protein (TIRG00374 family)